MRKETDSMDGELLELLADELGKILQWEEECPGVYYLGVLPEDEGGGGREYYLVFENAPISQKVRAMGLYPPAPSTGQRDLLDGNGPMRGGAGSVVPDVGGGIIGGSPDDCQEAGPRGRTGVGASLRRGIRATTRGHQWPQNGPQRAL